MQTDKYFLFLLSSTQTQPRSLAILRTSLLKSLLLISKRLRFVSLLWLLNSLYTVVVNGNTNVNKFRLLTKAMKRRMKSLLLWTTTTSMLRLLTLTEFSDYNLTLTKSLLVLPRWELKLSLSTTDLSKLRSLLQELTSSILATLWKILVSVGATTTSP